MGSGSWAQVVWRGSEHIHSLNHLTWLASHIYCRWLTVKGMSNWLAANLGSQFYLSPYSLNFSILKALGPQIPNLIHESFLTCQPWSFQSYLNLLSSQSLFYTLWFWNSGFKYGPFYIPLCLSAKPRGKCCELSFPETSQGFVKVSGLMRDFWLLRRAGIAQLQS